MNNNEHSLVQLVLANFWDIGLCELVSKSPSRKWTLRDSVCLRSKCAELVRTQIAMVKIGLRFYRRLGFVPMPNWSTLANILLLYRRVL